MVVDEQLECSMEWRVEPKPYMNVTKLCVWEPLVLLNSHM
jgi:hypothetical protein